MRRKNTVDSVRCPVTVGREADLARLRAALEAAHKGNGNAVVLAGEAGLGKTRLATELRAIAEGMGMTTMYGACSEADVTLPYLPFVTAIGNYLAKADLEALRRQLGSAYGELGRVFPRLALETPPQDPSDPVHGKLRLLEGMRVLIELAGADRGLLIVIEDLQWVDESTREMLEYGGRRLHGSKVISLVTCRPEEIGPGHPLAAILPNWERMGVEVVRLRPLDGEAVSQFLDAVFGSRALPTDFCELLRQRSAGNPFVIEEILRDALDRGDISPTETGWRLPSLAQLRLPKTVRDSVLRRLARLPAQAADVLRAAAVLGRSFEYRTLAAVAGQDDPVVMGALRSCVEHQLVDEDFRLESVYEFRSTLTRDAVYEDLLAPQREALHSRAAEVLAADQTVPPVDLCHHLLAARRWEEAVPLALEASRRATESHAYRDAAALLGRVLPFLTQPEQRGEMLCQLGSAQLLAGDAAGAERSLRDGIALLEAAGAHRQVPGCRLQLGRCYWERARPDLALQEYERARRELEPHGPSLELATAYVRLASMAIYNLDGAHTVELARKAQEIAEAAGAEAPGIWAGTFLGLGLVQLGQVEEGIMDLDRSYTEAAARGLKTIAANALYNGIQVRIQTLRPLEARDRLQALRELEAGSMTSLHALRAEGQIHLWGLGNPALALEAFEKALVMAQEGETKTFEAWVQPHLAVTWARLDHLDRAREMLPPPRTDRERQDQVVETWARMRIALDSGHIEEAAMQALWLVDIDEWPIRVRLWLGDLAVEALLATERLEEARQMLERIENADSDPRHPWRLRMTGRMALAKGQLAAAASALTAAADAFWVSGVRHEEARTRIVLAEALAAVDVDRAEREARAAMLSARERGATFEERLARQTLGRLGRSTVTDDRVKEALETIHQPGALGRSPLVNLLPEGERSGSALRTLMVEMVEEMATSAHARDAEAGLLLRDYYVKRVGSQEVVAARLYLTRATFYRRLHRGWQVLAERLADRLG